MSLEPPSRARANRLSRRIGPPDPGPDRLCRARRAHHLPSPGSLPHERPNQRWEKAADKLDLLDAAKTLVDLRVPAGNRLERLKGDLSGYHSIRINNPTHVLARCMLRVAGGRQLDAVLSQGLELFLGLAWRDHQSLARRQVRDGVVNAIMLS